MTKGRISATIIRSLLLLACMSTRQMKKDHLAALAQHKTLTQARYYRFHNKLVQTDLGRRAASKLAALKLSNIHQPQDDLNDTKADAKVWKREETEQLKELFKEDLKTGTIEEAKVKEKLSAATLLEERPLKAVVLNL